MSTSKITNNTPEIFKRYQEQALRPANVEDGNTPVGTKQGKIFTSELTSNDFYNISYKTGIISATPAISSTGTLYNYRFEISYDATLVSGSLATFSYTSPGVALANGVYLSCASTTVSGTYPLAMGSGATFDITVAGGVVTAVTVALQGSSYAITDTIVVAGDLFGGTTPADDLIISPLTLNYVTTPGTYGSNLIKENDPFYIVGNGHNWIRGIINRVEDVVVTNPLPGTYNFVYTVYCTINDGDPLKIDVANDDFCWNRQLYMDGDSFFEAYVPRNLVAAFHRFNLDTYLYWNDVNQSSKRHAINVRFPVTTPPPPGLVDHYQTFGNAINFNGSLQPFADAGTGDISCIKITDPGTNFSHYRRVEFTDFGKGAAFQAEPTTTDGSLPIHEYYVEDISSIGGVGFISQTTPHGQPVATVSWISQVTPYGQPIFAVTTFSYSGTVVGPTVVGCASSSSGNGTGATFDVTPVVAGYATVVVNAPGSGYTSSETVTILGTAFGGVSPADDITFNPSSFVPVTYSNVPSTAGINGTGATFDVTYNNNGSITVVPNTAGVSYQLFESITINAANLGGGWASNLTAAVSSLVPTTYVGVPSTTTGAGTGATFNVSYDASGNISVAVSNPGINYAPGDIVTVAAIDLGGPPATNLNFTVTALGNKILVRAPKTEYMWGFPEPQISTYLEGLIGGIYNDYVVYNVLPVLGDDDYFFVEVNYAQDSSVPVTFSPAAVAAMLQSKIKIHNGVYRLSVLLASTVNATLGSNDITLQPGRFLPDYFVGTKVNTGGVFPLNTYITGINKQTVTLSNAASINATFNLEIAGTGQGYTSKARAKLRDVSPRVNFYLDPVYQVYYKSDFFQPRENAYSIAGIYSDNQKQYTEWTTEIYAKAEN